MTEEQKNRQIAALDRERQGYVTRIARLKAGRHDPLDEQELAGRVRQVDAELRRLKRSHDAGDAAEA